MKRRWIAPFADGVAWSILTKLDRRSIFRTRGPRTEPQLMVQKDVPLPNLNCWTTSYFPLVNGTA